MNIVYLILSYNIPSQHIFFIPLWVWIDFNILFLNWESVEISLRGVWFCFLIWRLLPVSSSQTSSSFVSIIFLIYVDKFTFTNFPWLHTLSILLSDCQHSHMQLLFIIFTYIELEFHFWCSYFLFLHDTLFFVGKSFFWLAIFLRGHLSLSLKDNTAVQLCALLCVHAPPNRQAVTSQ